MNIFQDIVYSHEHTTIDLSTIKKDYDCKLDKKEETIEEFKEIYLKGVSTIIDMTNIGMGRNLKYVEDVEKESNIKILKSTGFYKEPFLPKEVYDLDDKALAKVLIKEILYGIENTKIKANLIGEIGSSLKKIEDSEQKVFRAAAIAHIETGVPIVTHTTLGRLGIEQIKILKNFNVDIQKVILSHIDLSGDIEYMKYLLDTGVNIAFDTIGKDNYQSDENRVKWLKKLCSLGYSKQILVSMDITRKSHFKVNGGKGYSYLIDKFLPMLIKENIKENDIKNMICNNAKRIY